MLQHVDTRLERVPNVLFRIHVRMHAQAVFVRRFDDRLVIVEGQACVRLDLIDAGVREPLHLLRRLLRRGDVHAAEAGLHGARRAPRNPRPAGKYARADDFALVDAVADREDRLERRAEIDGGCDARHEQLLRGGLHHAHQHRLAAVRSRSTGTTFRSCRGRARPGVHAPRSGRAASSGRSCPQRSRRSAPSPRRRVRPGRSCCLR